MASVTITLPHSSAIFSSPQDCVRVFLSGFCPCIVYRDIVRTRTERYLTNLACGRDGRFHGPKPSMKPIWWSWIHLLIVQLTRCELLEVPSP